MGFCRDRNRLDRRVDRRAQPLARQASAIRNAAVSIRKVNPGETGYCCDVPVVDVRSKENAKCWKVDGTHAPGRGGGVDRSLARYHDK